MNLCACGCGKDAGVYSKTRTYNGERQVKGEPKKFVKGHYIGRRGYGRHQMPDRPDAPPCDPDTLSGPECRAVDCREPMHRHRAKDATVPRKCDKGHRRHAGRGVCDSCRRRKHVELGPVEQPGLTDEEMLDEWDRFREYISWRDFHERLGVSHEKWRAAYRRAEKAGDPRARRLWRDIPERELAIRERAELGLTNKGRGSASSREAS